MILIILASGRGSRCRNFTKFKPKCFIKINKNKTILDYLEDSFKLFNKIIIVTGYKSHVLEKKFHDNLRFSSFFCGTQILPSFLRDSDIRVSFD